METILTSRLLFDGEDRPVEGGRYGMVEMTPWRVRMLGHVAKGAGREIGLTAKSPAYSRKGMLELAADGSILAGRETLARLSRTVDEEVESVPVLLRTVDADDRTLRACRLDIGDRFAERYIDPLVTDEFPGLKDAHNVICAVRAYINWEDFGMDGMVHRKGWPAPSRLIDTIRANYGDIVRYREWAAIAKTRHHLGLKLPLAIMLVERWSSPSRVDAFWRPVFDGEHPLDPDSPQRWMLDRAAGRDFNQKDTLRLLITAWNRWMRQSVGEAIPLDDLETDLIF